MKINKIAVEKLLKEISEIDYRPKNKDGSLDVDAFNNLERVKVIKNNLKSEGIKKSSDLGENGFIVAAMLLRF